MKFACQVMRVRLPSGAGMRVAHAALLHGAFWVSTAGSSAALSGNMSAVAAGAYRGLFLTEDGTLWASGRNHNGQLGDGGSRDRSRPVQIATGVSAVAAGAYHTLILKRGGSLWGAGDNGWGRRHLGRGFEQLRPDSRNPAAGPPRARETPARAGRSHTMKWGRAAWFC
jgi:hypothetical protein